MNLRLRIFFILIVFLTNNISSEINQDTVGYDYYYSSKNGVIDANEDWKHNRCCILGVGSIIPKRCFRMDTSTGLTNRTLGSVFYSAKEKYIKDYNCEVKRLIKENGLPWFSKKGFLKEICNMEEYFFKNKQKMIELSDKPVFYKIKEITDSLFLTDTLVHYKDTTLILDRIKSSFFSIIIRYKKDAKVFILFGPKDSNIAYLYYKPIHGSDEFEIKCIDLCNGYILASSEF